METNNSYVSLLPFMVEDLHLKGNELIIYAIIYGMSMDGTGVFYGSLKYLQSWTNAEKSTILDCLKRLMKKKLIDKREVYNNGVKYCQYWATNTRDNSVQKSEQVVVKSYQGGTEILPGVVVKSYQGGSKIIPNNNNIYNLNNNNIYKEPSTKTSKPKETKMDKKPKPPLSLKEVEDYVKANNYNVDAKKFYDYYTASDWYDKEGSPVLNWKQRVITWNGRSGKWSSQQTCFAQDNKPVDNAVVDLLSKAPF